MPHTHSAFEEAVTESPIRVLFFDHTAKLSGGEIALANLVRAFDRQLIHPVVLLCSEGPLADRLRAVVETHVIPLPVHVLAANKDTLGWRSLFKLRSVWSVFLQCWRVAQFIKHHDIALLHTNSLKADIIGGLAARMAGIPAIWHVRDRIEIDYLPASVVRGFRCLCRFVPTYLIANSEATLATLHLRGTRGGSVIPIGVEPDNRMLVVHDGCDVRQNSGEPFECDGARIGLVGRISPWKGQHIFLRAAALVLKRRPRTRFEIIGAPLFSERDYEQSLHALCFELKIAKSVEFVGFVEDVFSRITELDILVHASTTAEPFGQVIIEGMAAGKPVIATRGGGVPEIVLDGVTGLLIPMGDVESMAKAIEDLLCHPELLRRMGRMGRERALNYFTIDRTARRVEAVYRHVLGRA